MKRLLTLGLAVSVLGSVTGCRNTAAGISQDSENARKGMSEGSKDSRKAAAQSADKGNKMMSNSGQNISGALKVTPIVKTAILADAELNNPKNHIDVDSHDGTVHLRGNVTTERLVARAVKVTEDCIRDNHFNDKVMNHLVVQP